ncbi:prion-inhibition and propagation-domain-containing protein [Clohesyomyces aquaticus]|uniref:Prion-inhibition and propagation-domain-containing protein n=1 Tax=Clohesyomyces aquaticus TaxID=1231657 RepID=A0A1Y1Y8G0_9PLEO|nr:prion-inhibition and propagation-domain-containing protein [Clohesyomyces aquaticus]
MEAAGLVVGVAGLAGLFSACSNAFQLVQRGRTFGQDYKILGTKFGNQELRLRAWGRACGLIDGTAYDTRLDEEELRQQLVATLECIKLLLTDAKDLKERYGLSACTERGSRSSSAGSSFGSSSSSDSSVVQIPQERRMSGSLNRLLFRRSRPQANRSASTFSMALWVIEDREKFGELVKHLKDFIDDLESLTRATEIPHRQMIFVEYEIESISDVEELEVIEVAREGEDDVVSDAASARLERLSQGTLSIRASMESEFSFLTLESYVTARTHFSRASSIADSEKIGPTATKPAAATTPTWPNSGIRTSYKCVVVGGRNARKTELLKTFTKGRFDTTHTALVFEEYVMDCRANDQDISLALWDTSGQEDYENMLKSTIANADVVIICTTVWQLQTPRTLSQFEILWDNWATRFTAQCPCAKYVIAGILESPQPTSLAKIDQSKAKAKEIGAFEYVQCCLETLSGVKELFQVTLQFKRGSLRICYVHPAVGDFHGGVDVNGRRCKTSRSLKTNVMSTYPVSRQNRKIQPQT